MKLIDEEYTKHPFYGTRRMRRFLRNQGYRVNRKRVQGLYRLMVSAPFYRVPPL
ncbi:MAG: IS3 family transposase [Gammaproteobacteria bacterium]